MFVPFARHSSRIKNKTLFESFKGETYLNVFNLRAEAEAEVNH